MIMMDYEQARTFLEEQGQGHVLAFWARLNPAQRAALMRQIEALDPDVLRRIRTALAEPEASSSGAGAAAILPAPVVELAGAEALAAREAGVEALRLGRVGVILVAGGQGTRLGYDGPKGTYRLAPLSGASLFEIHARKMLALERRYGAPVPFYIMTSQANDAETRRFFERHGHFGLNPERVHCFSQGMLPAFWPDGRMVLEAPDRLFTAPDGHGGILAALARTGMLADMRRRGLATLFYFQVDNPMVDIADPAFIGLHLRRGAEMSIKVCAKRDPSEGLGVVVERGGRHAVVEYTELTEAQKQARRPDGDLLFKYGSVAIHVFSLDFLERETSAGLPLHQARKKVPYCGEDGVTVKPSAANACKFEKFIFDALPDAARPLVLAFAREDEFAPVKNAEGSDSPATARAAMMEKAARWLAACGVAVPREAGGRLSAAIEIDPAYAQDADELKTRLPEGFVLAGDLWLK
jgi:UDP-N-acetylglucosamine/UDP-N-acetylgalactosamine diphosphorylase